MCGATRRCRRPLSRRPRRRDGHARAAAVVSAPEVVVHNTADLLAKAIAARLVTRLVDAQAARGGASLVLTGGRLGTSVLAELRTNPARDAVDWRRVDIWWGDERWLPAGDPERNDRQARDALLDAIPLSADRVHSFPSSDGPWGNDPEAAAAAYAASLPPRRSRKTTMTCRGSTSSCWAWARRATPPRSSRSHRRRYDDRAVVAVHGVAKASPDPTHPHPPGDRGRHRGVARDHRRREGRCGGDGARRRRTGADPGGRRAGPVAHPMAARPRRSEPAPPVAGPAPPCLSGPSYPAARASATG